MDEKVLIKSKAYNIKLITLVLSIASCVWFVIYIWVLHRWFSMLYPIVPLAIINCAIWTIDWSISSSSLTVTNERVYGKILGLKIDLPLYCITSVDTIKSHGITMNISFSSKPIRLYFLKNRDDVYSALAKLLANEQRTVLNVNINNGASNIISFLYSYGYRVPFGAVKLCFAFAPIVILFTSFVFFRSYWASLVIPLTIICILYILLYDLIIRKEKKILDEFEKGYFPQGIEQDKLANENTLIKFYDQCAEAGVTDLNSEARRQKAFLIANRLKLTIDAADAFNKGKALKSQRRDEYLDRLRELEEKKRIELTKYTSDLGRDKPVHMLNDMIVPYIEKLDSLKKQIDEAAGMLVDGPKLKKKHDWAVIGGITSGLAGGAAGVAAALDAQQKNANIRSINNTLTQLHVESAFAKASHAKTLQQKTNQKLRPLEKKLEEVKIKLVENSDEWELLKNIDFEDVNIEFSETGAFTITACPVIKKEITMFNDIPAVIDGTLKANVYQNGKCVGEALMAAGLCGFGVTQTYDDMYLGSNVITGICLSDTSTAVEDKPYEVKFEPYHLWKMEA